MEFVNLIEAKLPASIANAYRLCIPSEVSSIPEMKARITQYQEALESEAEQAEFLDLETARRVYKGCETLLMRMESEIGVGIHRAVQAAVNYFILEDDGEDDHSVIGFDDDWLVVEVTASELGWSLGEQF